MSVENMRPNIPNGGPEAFIANFLSITNGAEILVISIGETKKSKTYRRDGIKAYSYNWKYGTSPVPILQRLYISILITTKLLLFRPTHVLCWQTRLPLWLSYLSARVVRAKFIASKHGRFPTTMDRWYQRLAGFLDKWFTKQSDFVLCHGPYLAQELKEIPISDNKILEFDWNYTDFLGTPYRQKVSENWLGKLVILYIGRLIASKGIFDLLEASVEIIIGDPNVLLMYIGDGPAKIELEMRISRLNIESQVSTLGKIPHEILGHYIRQCHVVVTPTRSEYPEGRCEAAIEGLVTAKPVIAPEFGPFPYLITHERNGLLFKPDSVNDLCNKLNLALYNKALYSRLLEGAQNSSMKLTNPKATFPEVLKIAFET
jgi:glycosyltransferase involved in cell wall biosynthesis